MNFIIEISEWEFFVGEGRPKITKIDIDPDDYPSEPSLKEVGIKRALDAHMRENLGLDAIARWEHYARESIGITWKAGKDTYKGQSPIALCWNMAIRSNWADFATLYTIRAYVKQITKGA
tara:strand:- start:172 stop:531 length:360 start_codon:yes stop_codon:yes gene_type:complete